MKDNLEMIIREYNDQWELDLIQFMAKGIWSVDFLREMVERAGYWPKCQYEAYIQEMIKNMDRGIPYSLYGSNSIQIITNTINYIKHCKLINKDLKLDLYKLDMRQRYLMTYNSGKLETLNLDIVHVNFLNNFPSFCEK